MKKVIALMCMFLLCAATVFAQGGNSNEVAGLKLPAPKTVEYDAQFITVTAETKGAVKWLVLSTSQKLKYKVHKEDGNEVDVGIPPEESVITIFAIALVDGKMTDYARTDITVKGPPGPGPAPNPPASVVKLPLHVTIVEDPTKRTPEIRDIIDSAPLRAQLESQKCITRVYSKNDPKLVEKGIDKLVATMTMPVLIIQDSDGRLLFSDRLPLTQSGVLNVVAKVLAGGK